MLAIRFIRVGHVVLWKWPERLVKARIKNTGKGGVLLGKSTSYSYREQGFSARQEASPPFKPLSEP